jgi:hypothetical protein
MKMYTEIKVELLAFLTSALDGGEGLVPRPLYAIESAPCRHCEEAGVASEEVWTLWRRDKYFALAGNRTLITLLFSS